MRLWSFAIAVVIFFASLCVQCTLFDTSKGYLLIIGGGNRPQKAIEKFVQICKGEPILVITSASEAPFEVGSASVTQFREYGAKQVNWLHIDSPAVGNADVTIEQIQRCRGIFFCGGISQRLMQRMGSTRAEDAIREVYESGGIIGGTSAGATIMSRIMITGNELVDKDTTNSFSSIKAQNIETERGLGFLDDVIIDQHFLKRKRNNRLISAVLEHHNQPGIGIDESTAILVYPDDHFEVYGSGSVLIYDARQAQQIGVAANGLLRGRNILLHVLVEGDSFKIE